VNAVMMYITEEQLWVLKQYLPLQIHVQTKLKC